MDAVIFEALYGNELRIVVYFEYIGAFGVFVDDDINARDIAFEDS